MNDKLKERLKHYTEKFGNDYVKTFNDYDRYCIDFLEDGEEYVKYLKSDTDTLPSGIVFVDTNGYEHTKKTPYGVKKDILADMMLDGLADLQGVKGYSLKNYNTDNQWQREIKQGAINYIKDYKNNWFWLSGETGAGKTHICVSIVFELASKGIGSRYLSWTNFMSTLRNDLNNSGEKINIVKKTPILYIDDFLKTGKNFDAEKVRDYDSEIARDILWYRHDKNLPTIISSEVTLQDLSKINDAMVGRIKENSKEYLFQPKGKEKNWRMK